MAEVLVGAAMSIITGVVVWAILPRGAVMTRSTRAQDLRGQPLYDTWEVRNDSALPIKLTAVSINGVDTYNAETDEFEWVDLPTYDADQKYMASLRFDDESSELSRDASDRPWKCQVVAPGDTPQAVVPNNRSLRIKYRRAGWLGVLERRELTIHGGVE